MKNYLYVLFCCINLLGVKSYAAITVAAEAIQPKSSIDYLFNWDGSAVALFGYQPYLVESDENPRVEQSGDDFTHAVTDDSFGYQLTAVLDWDSDNAVNAINRGELIEYIANLTPALLDKHSDFDGLKLGIGVENGLSDDDNRRDRVGAVGEALILTFDTSGSLAADSSVQNSEFFPETSDFINNGLNANTALRISQLHLEPSNITNNNNNRILDYFVYDASENAIISQESSPLGLSLAFPTADTNGTIPGPWILDDGDMIILAYRPPAQDDINLTQFSWGLWSLKMDLIDKSTLPSNPTPAPPQNGQIHLPGFPNIARTEGELIAEFETNPGDISVRTTVLDFHRGHLLMESRGIDDFGSSRLIWDLSNPETPVELEAFRQSVRRGGVMHTAAQLLPDIRINNFQDELYDVSNLPEITEPSVDYQVRGGGRGSNSTLPLQYLTGDTQITIWDAQNHEEHFITDNVASSGTVIPLGNLLIQAGMRGGSRYVNTYDVSDPANPVFLDGISPSSNQWFVAGDSAGYEPSIYQHYVVLCEVTGPMVDVVALDGGRARGNDDCEFIDFSDPTDLQVHAKFANLNGTTRYPNFQDNNMFVGQDKIDLSNLDNTTGIINGQSFVSLTLDHSGEFMLPLGNLLVVAENTEQSNGLAKIYAHQSAADTTPPAVAYHIPHDGDINQALTSRIGVVIHEVLDMTTIDDSTFRVYPTGGSADDTSGTLTLSEKDIITFVPDAPLLEGRTYEVSLEGITDISGNPMSRYSFQFSTVGDSVLPPPTIQQINTSQNPIILSETGSTTFSLDLAPYEQNDLELQWDFGDNNRLDWGSQRAPAHTYTQAGHYEVSVRVRNSTSNTINSTRMIITVLDQSITSDNRSIQSSQLTGDMENRQLWSVNPDNNSISAIDLDSLLQTDEIKVCKDPRSIAQASNGNLWVTCYDDDALVVVDPNGGIVNRLAFDYGAAPHDIAFDKSNTFALVTLYGSGKIVKIDTTSIAVIETLTVGDNPLAIALNSSDILVSRFISPDTRGEVNQFKINNGSSLFFNQTIPLVIDTESDNGGAEGRGLPNYLSSIVINAEKNLAYIASKKDNILAGHARDGSNLNHDTTVRSIISVIDLASGEELIESRIDLDNSSQPSSLVFSGNGDYLFVAFQGSNRVTILDVLGNRPTRIADLPVGKAPQGMFIDSTTDRLFVKNFTDRSITVHDLSKGFASGDFSNTAIVDISTVNSEVLPAEILLGKQVFYNANDERMSEESYLSCASCHQDGGHDGRTWDFTHKGEGLRNTTSLIGRAGMKQGNIHWTANFDEIQDFELDIVNEFGGTGFITSGDGPNPSLGSSNAGLSEDLDALAAYVSHLDQDSLRRSPYRLTNGELTTQALSGRSLFLGGDNNSGNPLGCINCHNPTTDFTNSSESNPLALHDVGSLELSTSGNRLGDTLTGIDTPTLIGIFETSPYLHDGRAKTIEDVFNTFDTSTSIDDDGHAHDIRRLSTEEQSNLMAYLLQIDQSEEAENTAPQVSFSTSTLSSIEVGYKALNVQADVQDSGSISHIQLFLNDTLIRQDNHFPYEWNSINDEDQRLAGLTAGVYRLKLVATDIQGASSETSLNLNVAAIADSSSKSGGGSASLATIFFLFLLCAARKRRLDINLRRGNQ